MQFIDQATIVAASGAGGHGSRHFRREKFAPRGGPDGGDGGGGGDLILVADARSRSLLDYHFLRAYSAEDGKQGMGSRKSGKDGASLTLPVPPGTQVFDNESGELLADLVAEGQQIILLKGGNGGWGNQHFATATRQAPDHANPGQPGERKTLRFELKLLADVALVGYPNAGKSSLIRVISASQAKVADYPFTTLVPNLGVVRHAGRVFTVADIPGLIEGAADGAGLGHQFLRHIERCRLLLFLLAPLEDQSPQEAMIVLERELRAYNPAMLDRPRLIVLTKIDLLGADAADQAKQLSDDLKQPVLAISSLTRVGLDALLGRIVDFFPTAVAEAPAAWSPLQK